MLDAFRVDLERLRRYGYRSRLALARQLLSNQGLWAIACYRVGRHLYVHRLPPGLHQLALLFYLPWQKLVEITTGIILPPGAEIGPGLYITHFGGIIVHPGVKMGSWCNLSQGVTLGVAGRGEKRGAPLLGDRVFIAAGAKVIGRIHLASGTVVGANAVVTHDTDENAVVGGVPARVISHAGSAEFIDYEAP